MITALLMSLPIYAQFILWFNHDKPDVRYAKYHANLSPNGALNCREGNAIGIIFVLYMSVCSSRRLLSATRKLCSSAEQHLLRQFAKYQSINQSILRNAFIRKIPCGKSIYHTRGG